jgi:hypothetical protein
MNTKALFITIYALVGFVLLALCAEIWGQRKYLHCAPYVFSTLGIVIFHWGNHFTVSDLMGGLIFGLFFHIFFAVNNRWGNGKD